MVLELWEFLCFVAIAKSRNPPHGETTVNACTTKPLTHAQPNRPITQGQVLQLWRSSPTNSCIDQVMTMVELWMFLCFVAKTRHPPHSETRVDACTTTKPSHHLETSFARTNLCIQQVMTMAELWVFLCFIAIAKTKNPPHGEASIDA